MSELFPLAWKHLFSLPCRILTANRSASPKMLERIARKSGPGFPRQTVRKLITRAPDGSEKRCPLSGPMLWWTRDKGPLIEAQQPFAVRLQRASTRRPAACAASRVDDRGWRDRQPGSMWMVEWEEPDGTSHAVLLGGLGPAQGCQGPPANKLARPVAGPLPAPLLRRLASAPPVGPG